LIHSDQGEWRCRQ